MDSKEMKALVAGKIQLRQAQIDEIKAKVVTLANDVMEDCQEILGQLPTLPDFGNIVIDIADDATNTGLFDVVDGVVMKLVFGKVIYTPENEAKYLELRAKVLAGIEGAQGTVGGK